MALIINYDVAIVILYVKEITKDFYIEKQTHVQSGIVQERVWITIEYRSMNAVIKPAASYFTDIIRSSQITILVASNSS